MVVFLVPESVLRGAFVQTVARNSVVLAMGVYLLFER
jgi:hypothetical protein